MATLPQRFGAYWLLESLGAGSMGDVHLARPVDDASPVPSPLVVKRIRRDLTSEAMVVARFKHEAEVATRIDSEHVAKIYDVGAVGEVLYIAMEFVPGCTVERLVKDSKMRGPLPLESVLSMMRGCLIGLAAVHNACGESGERIGLVHRDVSPRNVIIGIDQKPRLIDLGIGRSKLREWQTRTGVVIGTPGYMAPEQVMAEDVDHRADLFSVGALLYEVLTQNPYIRRTSIVKMLIESRAPTFVAPSVHRGAVSPELDSIFERLLRVDPSERFESAEDVLAALDDAVGDTVDETEPELLSPALKTEIENDETKLSHLLDTQVPIDEPPPEPTKIFAYAPTFSPPPHTGPTRSNVLPIVLAIAAVAVGVGALISVMPGSQPRLEVRVPKRIAPTPAVSVQPRAAEVEVEVKAEPAPRATKSSPPRRRSRRRRRRAVEAPPPVPTPPPPAPAAPPRTKSHAELSAELAEDIQRVQALLKDTEDPARVETLSRLMGALSAQRSSPRLVNEQDQVRRLRQRVQRAQRPK